MQTSKLILGHNSFFGINHSDYEKGKEKSEKFKNNYSQILDILSYASKKNINNFMISTLDESEILIKEIEKTNLINSLNFYILLPYINKFVRKSNELGLLGVVKDQISKAPLTKNIKYGLDFSDYLLKSDLKKILSILIDIELQTFKNVKKKVIILHDALTDILVSLERKDIIIFFIDIIKTKYNCEVGFATKNFPRFIKFFNSYDQNINVLTHANTIGFNMNPNKETVEKELIKSKYKLIYMSVLASGYLNYKPAIDYIKKINFNNNELVIGCSSKMHIDQISDYLNSK